MVETASSRSVTPGRDRREGARLRPAFALAFWIASGALGDGRLAEATTVIAKDFRQICREADLVFVGTVVEVESAWADEKKQSIETHVMFSDLLPLFGVDGPTVRLRFGGGEMDGMREEIAGVPRFSVGDRVVIFARDERSLSPIVGFHQGSFAVVEGPNGPVVLGSEHRPVTSVDGAQVRLGAASASLESALTLDAFVDVVRRELAARGTPTP